MKEGFAFTAFQLTASEVACRAMSGMIGAAWLPDHASAAKLRWLQRRS
jgi:hypothetical protein